jgi:polyferredoxin
MTADSAAAIGFRNRYLRLVFPSVQRDRNPNFVRLVDGGIRNAYTIHVLNKTHELRGYTLAVEGLAGARISTVGDERAADRVALSAKPDAVASARVFVTLPAGFTAARESTPIEFVLRQSGGLDRAERSAVFVAPHDERSRSRP